MYDLKGLGQRTEPLGEEKGVNLREFLHSKLEKSFYTINEGTEERKSFKEVN